MESLLIRKRGICRSRYFAERINSFSGSVIIACVKVQVCIIFHLVLQMAVTPNDLQSSDVQEISILVLFAPSDLHGKLRSPWLTMRVMMSK